MNSLPWPPYPQPLTIDLIHEAYDNIQQGKYYYIRERATDPSGNVIVLADYQALIIQKEENTIAVDMKTCRLADSGGDLWISSTGDEEIHIHDRTTICSADWDNSVWFFRPVLPTAETNSYNGSDSDSGSDTDNND